MVRGFRRPWLGPNLLYTSLMLRGLRKASSNWIGKTILGVVVGFLVISFAIWGIGDIFRGFGRSSVAKVGDTEIGAEQFRQIYNDRLQQIGAQAGRPISADQARALGLDRQIIGQLISETALDQRARRLGLGISDDEVARQIREIPAFQGLNGRFDPRLFEQRIRSAGYNEPRFVAEQRRFMVRHQLSESVAGLTAVPNALLEALHRFQNEQRAIEFVSLGAAQAGDLGAPDHEQLAAYFERSKAQFRAPEYRKLVVLALRSADVAKWIQVSDADARKFYEERRSRYLTSGRRHLEQIVFSSADDARTAKDRIASGVSFEDLAKERGLSEKDIDLGLVSRTGALAPAVADAAFALPEGGVSDPVQSRVGLALVKVLKIEPDRVRSFEEAAGDISQEIARDRTRAEINEKHDRIEDERAAGQTLAEAAQKIGVPTNTIDAVDRSGRDPGGAPVAGLPPEADVLATAFATDVGVETDPIRLPDGGYVWIEVAGITPAHERSLGEVQDRVEARWREEQIAERLRAKSSDLLEKLKLGSPLAELARATGLTVESATDLRRGAPTERISPATLAAVFSTSKEGVGSAEGETPAERVIFRVTDIAAPPLDLNAAAGKRLQDTVRTALSGDLLGQYMAQVERDLGATINQDAMRRVVGGESY
jgi:peptidyl-prolyl cis-trans isomerase D